MTCLYCVESAGSLFHTFIDCQFSIFLKTNIAVCKFGLLDYVTRKENNGFRNKSTITSYLLCASSKCSLAYPIILFCHSCHVLTDILQEICEIWEISWSRIKNLSTFAWTVLFNTKWNSFNIKLPYLSDTRTKWIQNLLLVPLICFVCKMRGMLLPATWLWLKRGKKMSLGCLPIGI